MASVSITLPVPRPPEDQPVHVIRSDEEAIAAASALAAGFAEEAARRDRERILPVPELQALSRAGLFAITVPKAFGGAQVSVATLARVTQILAAADPSIGQIPQNHFAILERLKLYGTAEQKAFFFPRILAGEWLGNATAEPGDKRPGQHATRLTREGGRYRLDGRKIYATGALYAQWIPVAAVDENGAGWVVFTPRHAAGISVIDDWSGFGQRTTASGTVVLEGVAVEPIHLFPSAAQAGPDTTSSVSQIIHAAIDLGIAEAAIADTLRFLRTSSNPGRGSGATHATADTLTVREVGSLKLSYHVAETMIERAARLVDAALHTQKERAVTAGMIAVAEAKILSSELAILATNKLFELAGTHSTLARHNLDRHWRNARTHTLHDAVRWKYHVVGNYYLNDLVADPWSFGHPYRPLAGD